MKLPVAAGTEVAVELSVAAGTEVAVEHTVAGVVAAHTVAEGAVVERIAGLHHSRQNQ